MKKYIKKSIEVEAIQFTEENRTQVFNWARNIQHNIEPDWDESGNPIIKIPTLEGDMICSLGDYLIIEPFPTDWRKIYPCKEGIFKRTYEEANP